MNNRNMRMKLLKEYLTSEHEKSKIIIPEFESTNESINRFLEKIDVAMGFENGKK